jgi:hypothetical protein
MSYIILRGRWCHIVLNVHVPTEDNIHDVKVIFYEKLEHVFDKYSKCLMNSVLGNFSAKRYKEDILKPTVESLHEIINDNGKTHSQIDRILIYRGRQSITCPIIQGSRL